MCAFFCVLYSVHSYVSAFTCVKNICLLSYVCSAMSALMCSHMSAPLCSHLCVIIIIIIIIVISTASIVSF